MRAFSREAVISCPMPELPEVESARAVIERAALGRKIAAVDDSDRYECRPHAAGEIASALTGTTLTAAHRRGKSMWCETDGGPVLGIHLGMSGKIVITEPDGAESDGGDYWKRGRAVGDHRHTRFSLTFADGGMLRLVDPRRLGRVRLDPMISDLGPDAGTIGAQEFSDAIRRGRAPVKVRLLDQHVLAGVGNLLADEITWRAGIDPARTVDTLTEAERDALYEAVRESVADAIRDGGVHTLTMVSHRTAGGHCPRDGAELRRGKVGGRTTFWCPDHQA